MEIDVTVYDDGRARVLDRGRFSARWEGGRLFIRWRETRYPVCCDRCERREHADALEDNWLRPEHGMRADDAYFIYYDD